METRSETKSSGAVVLQVLAAPGLSDGDVAAILRNAVIDLHYNVLQSTETIVIRGKGQCLILK